MWQGVCVWVCVGVVWGGGGTVNDLPVFRRTYMKGVVRVGGVGGWGGWGGGVTATTTKGGVTANDCQRHQTQSNRVFRRAAYARPHIHTNINARPPAAKMVTATGKHGVTRSNEPSNARMGGRALLGIRAQPSVQQGRAAAGGAGGGGGGVEKGR